MVGGYLKGILSRKYQRRLSVLAKIVVNFSTTTWADIVSFLCLMSLINNTSKMVRRDSRLEADVLNGQIMNPIWETIRSNSP